MSSISFNGRSFGNLGVDMLAPSLKRFYFTLLFFVKKIDDLMFFLVISNSGPVYFAVPPLVFQKQGCLNFQEHPSIIMIPKYSRTESFRKLLRKAFMMESFLSTISQLSEKFPKSCLNQLFCREPVSVCFCKSEPQNRRYLRNFPEF